MHIYSDRQGAQLIKAARNTIELSLMSPDFNKGIVGRTLEEFSKPYGVFVTLEHYPTRELRGCIGFPRPIAPLGESVVEASLAAAFEDPRFVSVSSKELDEMLVEVSILSGMEPLGGSSKRRMDGIKIGRDGLMVEYGFNSGLLHDHILAVPHRIRRLFCMEHVRVRYVHQVKAGEELPRYVALIVRNKVVLPVYSETHKELLLLFIGLRPHSLL